MALTWQRHADGAVEYTRANGNQLAICRYNLETGEYYFSHISFPKELPWAEGLRCTDLRAVEFLVQAMDVELKGMGL